MNSDGEAPMSRLLRFISKVDWRALNRENRNRGLLADEIALTAMTKRNTFRASGKGGVGKIDALALAVVRDAPRELATT